MSFVFLKAFVTAMGHSVLLLPVMFASGHHLWTKGAQKVVIDTIRGKRKDIICFYWP